MSQTVFYQSSLPRAGSTLLQNIIGQNPQFHVTPTSGMIDLMLGTRIGYNGNKESKAGDKDMWREGFYAYCREGFKGYLQNHRPRMAPNTRRLEPYGTSKSPGRLALVQANRLSRWPPGQAWWLPNRTGS